LNEVYQGPEGVMVELTEQQVQALENPEFLKG
jgi:hypothetical protein